MSQYKLVVNFQVSKRRMPKMTREWLIRKKDYFQRMWETKGSAYVRSIEKNCGMNFPNKTRREGMTVFLYCRKRDDPLGDMIETKPLLLNVYVRKSETWKDIKGTLIHEIIHCLVWQKYYFDYRTKNPTFFADIFADELITSVIERIVLGKKSRKECV